MFERYTEGARRVIFFGRYEATAFGSHQIETIHLLLGALREGEVLVERFLRPGSSIATLRSDLTAGPPVARAQISTSVDVHLSMNSKRVLAYAAEESERLGHRFIDIVHLLLGLLRDPTTSEFLHSYGVTREAVVDYGVSELPNEQVQRGRRCISVAGGELVVTDAVAPGAEPATIEYSLTVEGFGQKRSWRTSFRVV
jgi:ATP-dependent Clp protease ATP-binding subunit ClpC